MSMGWILVLILGCQNQPTLSGQDLLDPKNCAECHPTHYDQWVGSMHAYASTDPVFVAMNARGQRETNGELGDFCVKCHAPMAVYNGETTDGLNLDELPESSQGVGCAWCHLADEAIEDHNGMLNLATDEVLRGGVADPIHTSAHRSGYSAFHDRNDNTSSQMCGACHDIITPSGVHLERTFAEWKESIFSADTAGRQSCGHCHMRGEDGPISNVTGSPHRRLHDHKMVGVDIALTNFPGRDTQRQATQHELDHALMAELCVVPSAGGSEINVRIDNVSVGHRWPSGASQDRRAWVEIRAFKDGEVIFETGAFGDDEPIIDENTWVFHDRGYDTSGEIAHMFWDIAYTEVSTLAANTTLDPTDPAYYHAQERSFPLSGIEPDRVEMRVRIRPVGLDMLEDLVSSGDLEADIISQMPVFDLGSTVLQWNGPIGSCVE